MEVVIVGGTGFIGKYLVNSLVDSDRIKCVRVLSRENKRCHFDQLEKVSIICGDVLDRKALVDLIVEGSIVVNLAYLNGAARDDNLKLINNLLETCQEKKIKKFIHVSTAVVNGRVKESIITEDTSVFPFSEYDKTKVLVENAILDNGDCSFESIIVRPTAVFGPGGKNLIQLANDLRFGSSFKNYLKSCLYGARAMNLVSVEDVVSALDFIIFNERNLDREVLLVADDKSSNNNYIAVEEIFMSVLGVASYPLPRVIFPSFFLELILRAMRKSNIHANRRYSSEKLEKLGWVRALDFDRKVREFAAWAKKEGGS